MAKAYEREDGAWVLPLAEGEVQRVCQDAYHGIVLCVRASDDICEVLLGEFTVTDPLGRRQRVDSDDFGTYGPVFAMVRGIVREAIAGPAADLAIVLWDGTRLEAHGDPRVESWEIRGPDGLLVVAGVGGHNVSVWI